MAKIKFIFNGVEWNEAHMKAVLSSDVRAIHKAILRIYEKQTADEQATESTQHHNGVGFTGTDAHILSSFAKQIVRGRTLSEKQLAIAKRKMPKYAGQLLRIAQAKLQNQTTEAV